MAKGKRNPQLYIFGLPALIVITLVYLPNLWIYIFMLADYFTPWKIFESAAFNEYHNFLVSRLPEREELSIPELHANSFTKEDVIRLSHGFTFPIVIREVLVNTSGVKEWSSSDWWLQNYPDEGILCGTLDHVRPSCTIKDFFDEIERNNPFYISGASKIFTKNPDLANMVEDDRLKMLEPSERVSTQIFMGLKDMGSDIHSAIGVNIFRQMVGRKKWWFIPPSQTPYLKPSINVNGFSAHTHTLVGKNGEAVSPWMNKIERYTAVLNPGDVLINPPWFWHGILNLGEKSNDLVVGVPTRYGGRPSIVAAMKSNAFMSLFAFAVIYFKYGGAEGFKAAGDVLEDKIQANRVARMKD
mmetsp:Transcript_23654/g.34687  ORF Transcript_23654/g.34687 Transcript_23654/m.34687 type:complete len:356 (-) Transcript_23654:178-1245(-)